MCLYRMMRTWTDVGCFCFILFVFVLLLPVTSQEQQGDPEPSSDETERAQIIPGKRIGRYVLCMEKKTLFKGKTRSEINEQLREEKIFPAFKEHGLRWVVTWNESHTTPNGLKVDSSVQEVTEVLGETEKSRLWDEDSSIISDRKVLPYQDRGIGFILDKENKTVHAIVVAPKKKKGENDETNDASSEKSDDEKTPCK